MSSWYHTIFNKNPELKELSGNHKKMPRNIYERNTTVHKHAHKFHAVHYIFKYKFLVPLILLMKKLFKNILIKKIPNEHHNRNIIIFDKAYEQAIIKWNIYYRRNSGDRTKRKNAKFWIKRAKSESDISNDSLRTLKQTINTMYLYDTAYREFMNILMHEIAHEMVEYYAKHPEKFLQANRTGHLFFTTDIYDTNYFILEKAMAYNIYLSVEEAEKLLRENGKV